MPTTNFPASIDSFVNAQNNTLAQEGHVARHNHITDAIFALETKVGADSSAVTSSLDYKLSGVTGSDKAVSKTGTETLTNKTITTPTITNPTVSTGTFTSPTLNTPTFSTGAVGGADLSTSAITLGYAETTTPQGTFTADTDLTDLTVTVIVPAGGRRIKILGFTAPSSSVSDDGVFVKIKEGASTLQTAYHALGGANFSDVVAPQIVITPSAGSHTYKLSMGRQTGTGDITNNAAAGQYSFILVELI